MALPMYMRKDACRTWEKVAQRRDYTLWLQKKDHGKRYFKSSFGLLTAIERNGSDNSHKALWLCECECGKTTTVRASDLISGKISSCGCVKTTLLSENLVGKRFGRLNVTDRGEKQKG